ncbi:MgtC/SapB family protein [Nitrobacter sp. 62-23]|jgi:putative Mg2+ transporter-C (MgtC) family protein|uniref:MgtC/SapB family protein n=1 Tax=Nitrobacter sp. 62-23 TaxID=1895798 RepID=UPI000AB88C39|nr:MgtC/SapB family protein [Nitrobacter sp. 62-23]MBK5651945.1 MgtC/SapB family protein [Rhizobium sp.]MBN9499641.1 MgtC/SapB family protein [Alphaproteobacteria bacterium]
MFQALSRLSITEAARHAVTQLAVIALTLGLTTGGAFAAAGDAGGTTRFDLALLVRIAVAVALAFPIGWEREFRGSEAGDRTFMLVSLGAAAFTAVGVENFPATAEKIMAGVVTGVGFLGGGMILKDGGNVRGLTTAAAIWATSAVGMLAGIGELLIAGLVTVLVILILELQFLPLIGRLDARRWRPKEAKREGNGHEF